MIGERVPLRPTLPIALWLALALWVGLAVGEGLSAASCSGWLAWTLCCGAIALVVGSVFISGWKRSIAVLTAALLAGGWLAMLTWCSADVAANELHSMGSPVLEGRVSSDPVYGTYGSSFELSGALPGGVVRVFVENSDELELGRRVSVRGTVLPEDDQWARLDRRRGVLAALSATDVRDLGWEPGVLGAAGRLRAWAGDEIGSVRGEGSALLSGILLGDRRALRGTQLESDARAAGLAHIMAVSGAHLAVVAAFAAAIAGVVRLPRGVAAGLVLATCGAYVVVSGLQPSALRALGLVLAAQIAPILGRRTDPLSALAFVIVVILVANPIAAFSLGLMMSAAAVLGIIALGSLTRGWFETLLPRVLRPLGAPMAVCVTAQAATMPIIAGTFAQLPLIGVVSNLVAIPLVSLGLASGLAGLVLAPLGVGSVVLRFAGFALRQVAVVAHACASLPGAAVPFDPGPWVSVGAIVVLGVVWAIWPRPRRPGGWALAMSASLVGVLMLGGQGPPAVKAELIAMDVGQGDAMVLRSGGCSVLVDTGDDPVEIRRALARNGVRRVDRVLLTHAHADHTGGLEGLTGMMPGNAVLVSSAAEEAGLECVQPRYAGDALDRGDSFDVGELHVQVLWPPDGLQPDDENEASLVMYVTSGDFSALLTGDAEEPVYSHLAQSGLLPSTIDVLKVPHHGSSGGMSAETLRHLAPAVALVSVGDGNDFGHPSSSTLGQLSACGARTLRTDEHGDVSIQIGAEGWSVRTGLSATSGCETMPPERALSILALSGVSNGVIGPDRSQARLLDPWPRGPTPGTGRRPPEESLRSGGRSGLQPEDIRRRDCGRLRDRRLGQHLALHVRAPPGSRSQGRPSQDRRLERDR